MLETYQYIPEHINPIAISIGSFSIRWYSLGYLFGFLTVYLLLLYRIKKEKYKTSKFPISPPKADPPQADNFQFLPPKRDPAKAVTNKFQIKDSKFKILLLDFLLYSFVGLLVGARLGYVIFYDISYFIQHPLEIFLPIKVTGYGLQVTGLSGMSYFGGLIGVILSGVLFSKRNKVNFWQLADFVVPAIPAGYFFGRIGNFLNGELYGRITNVPWGMYFPEDPPGSLRHPSQLYEAFFEGIVLFAVLWILRGKSSGPFKPFKKFKNPVDSSCDRNWSQLESNGSLFLIYLFGYGLFRFFIEFFREPDPATAGLIFNFLTRGQAFSLFMIFGALLVYFWQKNRKML